MKQDYFRAVWTSAVAISRRVFTALFLLAALSSCQIPVLGQPGGQAFWQVPHFFNRPSSRWAKPDSHQA